MNYHPLPNTEEIQRALGLTSQAKARRWLRRLIWLVVLAGLAFGLWSWWQAAQQSAQIISYETEAVTRGKLTVTVTATGTLQPTTQVDVSSEISGIVRVVKVDHNSLVHKGEVLAELDTDRYKAQLSGLEAGLAGAKAKLADAKATLDSAETALDRQKKLINEGYTSAQNRDAALAAQLRARAAIDAMQAEIDIAAANITQKKLDIDKSTIRSPIDGIVLKRSAEPGQTVASSLQAPILFTLADDLRHMQLEADIDEADIGTVKEGQKATFTVDAYGGRDFSAEIQAVEFSPKVTDGVVTYKAILTVDNSDLALRPGMTATVKITVREVSDALLVSNAALRFSPPPQVKSEGFNISRLFLPRMPSSRSQRPPGQSRGRRVYVPAQGEPKLLPVETGDTDGKSTVIIGDALKEGDEVIVSSRRGAS